jgi:CHAT domain-containing protein/Tfp pilus assembly protein PilF
MAHFNNRKLSENERQLLQEFAHLSTSDSTLLEAYVIRNRNELRQIFPRLFNQINLNDLTDYTSVLPMSHDDIYRLTAVFARVHQEPAPWRRMQLFRTFSLNQKSLELEADYLIFLGDSLREKRRFPEAVSEYELALKRYQKIGDREGEAYAHFRIGYANYLTGKNLESLEPLNRSLELARNIREPFREMWALVRIGMIQADLRNYPESEKALHRGIEFSRKLQDRNAEARAKNRLSLVYWETGRLLEALMQCKECLQLYGNSDENFDRAESLRMMGFIKESLGDYKHALESHETSLRIFRQLGRHAHEAAQYTNVGLIHSLLGEHELALDCHKSALAIFKTYGTPGDLATALANVGEAYANLSKLEEAFQHLQEALRYADGPDYAAMRAEIYQMLGDVGLKQEDRSQAHDMFSKAVQINQKNGFRVGLILSYLGLGQTELQSKRWDEAANYFDQAIDYAVESRISTHAWKGYYGKGIALKALGDFSGALRNFTIAIDTIESARGRIEIERSKLGYFAEKQEVYDEAILTFLEEQKDPRRAFDFVERAKARSFLDVLQGGAEIVKKKSMLGQDEEVLALVAPVSFRSPTSQEIQNSLGHLDKIIEYRILRDRVVIWSLDNAEVKAVQINISRDELRKLVGKFREVIGAERTDEFKSRWRKDRRRAFEEVLRVAQQLSSILITPIWPLFEQQKNIYIVPDDILHYLPFEALTQPAPDSTKFIIEATPLAVAPSAAVLKYALNMRKAPLESKNIRVLAIADPLGDLKWARESAQSIIALFPGSRFLFGQQARKDSVYQAIENGYDVLHFATHCSLDAQSPLYTTLYLAPLRTTNQQALPAQFEASNHQHHGHPEDHLRMHEIFSLNLERTGLVVLSACKTALGGFALGEGLVGLTRAFMYAGTPSLVTTLWEVDDRATARLMEKFYLHLKSGRQSIAHALKKAQTDEIAQMRLDPIMRFPHPYFWAPFLVVGSSY